MPTAPEVLKFQSGDGTSNALTAYDGGGDGSVVVVLPAMGVEASYYATLAQAFQDAGVDAVTVDLRGHGHSNVRAGRRCDFGYREILDEDLPATASAVGERFPGRPIVLLGHSLGGQLACVWASTRPEELAGVVLVGACSIYHRCWPFPDRYGLLAFTRTAAMLARVRGHFPGSTLGFGGREARTLMRDWAHQSATGRYEPAGDPRDFEALLTEVEIPVLAISFTDDKYAPKPAVEHLLGKMPRARREHRHLSPADAGVKKVGHFSWARQPAVVVPHVVEWLNGRS